jgi:hypothetical protein
MPGGERFVGLSSWMRRSERFQRRDRTPRLRVGVRGGGWVVSSPGKIGQCQREEFVLCSLKSTVAGWPLVSRIKDGSADRTRDLPVPFGSTCDYVIMVDAGDIAVRRWSCA